MAEIQVWNASVLDVDINNIQRVYWVTIGPLSILD